MDEQSAEDVRIRDATRDDAAAIARLSSQLGYPCSAETMEGRLLQARSLSGSHVLVAGTRDGQVVGVAHLCPMNVLAMSRQAEIALLVVDDSFRGAGVGRKLLDEATRRATKMGCTGLHVRANEMRERACRFYVAAGFVEYKTTRNFRRPLSGSVKP